MASAESASTLETVAAQLWSLGMRCIVGGVLGGFTGGGLALLVSFALLAGTRSEASGMTTALIVVITACIAALGGVYIGALRGCSRAVGDLVEDHQIIPRLYRLIKPKLAAYTQRLRAGESPAMARKSTLAEFREDTSQKTATGATLSFAERTERYLAGLLYSALAGSLLRALTGGSVLEEDLSHWTQVEEAGLRRANHAFGDLLNRMFHGPILLALVLTALAAAVPHAVYILTGLG